MSYRRGRAKTKLRQQPSRNKPQGDFKSTHKGLRDTKFDVPQLTRTESEFKSSLPSKQHQEARNVTTPIPYTQTNLERHLCVPGSALRTCIACSSISGHAILNTLHKDGQLLEALSKRVVSQG
eukprot:3002802-Amphidinium_carterae.1